MKLISWNVQGGKKSQVTQKVRFLVKSHKSDIVFLLETMVNDQNITKIFPRSGLEHYEYVSPSNHSGELAILQNHGNIHASVLCKETRAIHLLIHDCDITKDSIILGIYALAQPIQKESFLNHLMELHHTFDLPWCLIGDFNELANPLGKRGGQVLAEIQYQRLHSFLCSINGESVHVNGH